MMGTELVNLTKSVLFSFLVIFQAKSVKIITKKRKYIKTNLKRLTA